MEPGYKACPFCAEPVREAATICRHCNRTVSPSAQEATDTSVPQEERVFFEDEDVSVSNLRFVSRTTKTTIAMANVSSVRLVEQPPSRTAPGLLLLACLVWMSIAFCLNPAAAPDNLYLPGAGFALSLIWLAVQRGEYVVWIQAAGGESKPVRSANRQFVQKVVSAVEQAIIARG